jgi:hemolysin III
MRVEMERWSLGKIQNPVRGFLHGTAALAGVVGTVLITMHARTWPSRVAVLIFGLAIIALYTTSSLYHSVPWNQIAKKRMQRLDYSMILVLIAGTYTPVLSVVFDGSTRTIALAVVWGIAVVGFTQNIFFPAVPHWFSVTLSTTLGWLGLFIIWPLTTRVGLMAMGLVVLGGGLYTIGMVFLVTNRPRLWPRVFSYHEAFHVLVVSATSVHFLVVWRYMIPLAR